MRFQLSVLALSILTVAIPGIATAQTTIYASDLTNKVEGGITGNVTGSGASSYITLTSNRNQDITWDLPSVDLTEVGHWISVDVALSLDAALSPESATQIPSLDIRLQNSDTGYWAAISLRTPGGGTGGIFPTSLNANNGGRFGIDAMSANAGSPNVFSFTLTLTEQPATSGLELSAAGSYITGGNISKEANSTPTSTLFDQIVFRTSSGDTSGDWNAPVTITLDDFSITSNVPEPSTYALCFAALILFGVAFYRRHKR